MLFFPFDLPIGEDTFAAVCLLSAALSTIMTMKETGSRLFSHQVV